MNRRSVPKITYGYGSDHKQVLIHACVCARKRERERERDDDKVPFSHKDSKVQYWSYEFLLFMSHYHQSIMSKLSSMTKTSSIPLNIISLYVQSSLELWFITLQRKSSLNKHQLVNLSNVCLYPFSTSVRSNPQYKT